MYYKGWEMKHKLISIASIIILLCVVLGSSIGCNPTANYTLTMASTAGGSVTPAVGAYNYTAGTVVNLTATPNSDYRFVNWTGGGADIGSATAATTIITMNADHTVTAHFAFNMTYIVNVPDTSQPPTSGRPQWCAPMAMINVLCYWDGVMGHHNAINVTAGLPAKTAADLLGWFMDTSNLGSPARVNAGQPGTLDVDIGPGTTEFVRWDAAHLLGTPPPALPPGKLGYNWTVTTNCSADYGVSLAFYKAEIDAGRPLVVSFTYWNPVFGVNLTDPQTGETISAANWGTPTSYHTDPDEAWSGDVGHAVTGVGYKLNWDPDGAGPLVPGDYVIVYDNWASTPKNIAIPWNHWKCLFAVNPGP
jgi:hypothetical protein